MYLLVQIFDQIHQPENMIFLIYHVMQSLLLYLLKNNLSTLKNFVVGVPGIKVNKPDSPLAERIINMMSKAAEG